MEQQIQFCHTPEGAHIAYQVLGAGPPIVFPCWWFSHLELLWAYAPARTFLETLARDFTVVVYDKPGCGLSDRDRPALALDALLDALAAVIDQLPARRLALFGFSQGAAPAIAFTARHPERVARLLLYSTGAWTPPPADPAAATTVWEAVTGLVRADWGLGSAPLLEVVCPGADPATRDWFARYTRESVERETAVAMLERFRTFDVRPLLGEITVPTLVMHRRDDRAFPFEHGRDLAAGIASARFVPLDGAWHFLFGAAERDVLELTQAFLEDDPSVGAALRGAASPAYPDRLSEREVQVLRLIAAGKTNRDIADWLVISPHTVVRHVSNIFDKTGVANRAEAATYAARHALIE